MPRLVLLVPTRFEARHVFGERGDQGRYLGHPWFRIGIGLVDAAVSTARLLADRQPPAAAARRPTRLLLVGFAGSLQEELVPGTALWGESCRLHGLGLSGESEAFVPFRRTFAGADEPLPPECLELSLPPGPPGGRRGVLLSVASASADPATAAARQRCYPAAAVEEMETYAVARAAQAAGCDLACLRAVTNRAGERVQEGPVVEQAAAELRRILDEVLARGGARGAR